MKKKPKLFKYLIIAIVVFGIGVFLVYKDQLKVTVVNTFTETSAAVENYFVLGETDKDLMSLKELGVENKKTFIFVSSNWCSLCDALTLKLKSSIDTHENIQVYEADLDEFRPQLSEFSITNAPSLLLLENGEYRLLENVSFNNIEQILSTEINN